MRNAHDTPTLYHVAPETYREGESLLSLYAQMGDGAYEEYATRWPDAGGVGLYHAHWVHLYATPEEAEDHRADFGGTVLLINAEGLEIEEDTLEGAGTYYVKDTIPASNITERA